MEKWTLKKIRRVRDMLNSSDEELINLGFTIIGKDTSLCRATELKGGSRIRKVPTDEFRECIAALNRMEYFGNYINDENE